MQPADLKKEVAELRTILSKQRLAIKLGAEKDSHKYQTGKRQVARLLTVIREKELGATAPLKKAKKTAKVSAPKAA